MSLPRRPRGRSSSMGQFAAEKSKLWAAYPAIPATAQSIVIVGLRVGL